MATPYHLPSREMFVWLFNQANNSAYTAADLDLSSPEPYVGTDPNINTRITVSPTATGALDRNYVCHYGRQPLSVIRGKVLSILPVDGFVSSGDVVEEINRVYGFALSNSDIVAQNYEITDETTSITLEAVGSSLVWVGELEVSVVDEQEPPVPLDLNPIPFRFTSYNDGDSGVEHTYDEADKLISTVTISPDSIGITSQLGEYSSSDISSSAMWYWQDYLSSDLSELVWDWDTESLGRTMEFIDDSAGTRARVIEFDVTAAGEEYFLRYSAECYDPSEWSLLFRHDVGPITITPGATQQIRWFFELPTAPPNSEFYDDITILRKYYQLADVDVDDPQFRFWTPDSGGASRTGDTWTFSSGDSVVYDRALKRFTITSVGAMETINLYRHWQLSVYGEEVLGPAMRLRYVAGDLRIRPNRHSTILGPDNPEIIGYTADIFSMVVLPHSGEQSVTFEIEFAEKTSVPEVNSIQIDYIKNEYDGWQYLGNKTFALDRRSHVLEIQYPEEAATAPGGWLSNVQSGSIQGWTVFAHADGTITLHHPSGYTLTSALPNGDIPYDHPAAIQRPSFTDTRLVFIGQSNAYLLSLREYLYAFEDGENPSMEDFWVVTSLPEEVENFTISDVLQGGVSHVPMARSGDRLFMLDMMYGGDSEIRWIEIPAVDHEEDGLVETTHVIPFKWGFLAYHNTNHQGRAYFREFGSDYWDYLNFPDDQEPVELRFVPSINSGKSSEGVLAVLPNSGGVYFDNEGGYGEFYDAKMFVDSDLTQGGLAKNLHYYVDPESPNTLVFHTETDLGPHIARVSQTDMYMQESEVQEPIDPTSLLLGVNTYNWPASYKLSYRTTSGKLGFYDEYRHDDFYQFEPGEPVDYIAQLHGYWDESSPLSSSHLINIEEGSWRDGNTLFDPALPNLDDDLVINLLSTDRLSITLPAAAPCGGDLPLTHSDGSLTLAPFTTGSCEYASTTPKALAVYDPPLPAIDSYLVRMPTVTIRGTSSNNGTNQWWFRIQSLDDSWSRVVGELENGSNGHTRKMGFYELPTSIGACEVGFESSKPWPYNQSLTLAADIQEATLTIPPPAPVVGYLKLTEYIPFNRYVPDHEMPPEVGEGTPVEISIPIYWTEPDSSWNPQGFYFYIPTLVSVEEQGWYVGHFESADNPGVSVATARIAYGSPPSDGGMH